MTIHQCAHRGDIVALQQELEKGVSIEAIAKNVYASNLMILFFLPMQQRSRRQKPLGGIIMARILIRVS